MGDKRRIKCGERSERSENSPKGKEEDDENVSRETLNADK